MIKQNEIKVLLMDNVHGGNVRRLYLVYFRINGKHLLVQNIFAE